MDSPHSNLLRRGRFSEPGRPYLITAVTHHRTPLFKDFRLARLVIRELRRTDQSGACRSLAWVVMPDHIHWLFELGDSTLASLMCQFKSRTSCALYKACSHQGAIWQPGYHDRALRKEEDLRRTARYIIANPIRAGLAEHVGHYPHWDCAWL
ncbi:MAG TPA: transposase [Pseudomonas sp.]|uniref:REP-associated tyrosine transposase n=1 Tax=Pseudomonas sp. TaxID=306 RepID=UPI002B48E146|nr:transposase [Pseudomonas sp.]HKS11977.1 transposase [Pseudomonas sp.]